MLNDLFSLISILADLIFSFKFSLLPLPETNLSTKALFNLTAFGNAPISSKTSLI